MTRTGPEAMAGSGGVTGSRGTTTVAGSATGTVGAARRSQEVPGSLKERTDAPVSAKMRATWAWQVSTSSCRCRG